MDNVLEQTLSETEFRSPGQAYARDKLKRWKPAIFGLGLGLYTSRIIAESVPSAWPITALLLLLIICEALGIALVVWTKRYITHYKPLILLYLYVLYPRPDLHLAWGILAVALLSLLILHTRGKRFLPAWAFDLGVFIAALALYWHTLAPTVLPADSGEFQFVSYLLGIAHPPGYPLYTLLGKLFTWIPLGDVAYRVNLLSAVTAAFALVVLARLVRRATNSTWITLVPIVALAASPTFWAQSTTANIRGLTALFTACQIYFLFRYGEKKNRSALLGFALSFGLGITHHGSLGLLAIPFALYLFLVDPTLPRRWRDWAGPLAIFLLSFLVLLYLPLRSLMGARFDPAPIRSLREFLDHVLARGFRGDMFAFARLNVLPDRLSVLGNILSFQFGYPLLVVASLGAARLVLRNARLFILFGGVFLVNAFVAITYRAPQTVEYLMPAYVALAVLIGYGTELLSEQARRAPGELETHHVLSAILIALPLWLGVRNLTQHYPSYRELSEDMSARQYAEALLREAPPNAVILANWHYATPLWYLQYVEALRPDVDVQYVYPEGATPLAQVWQRRIEAALSDHPTIITNHYLEFGALPYRFLPFYGAEQVIAGTLLEIPKEMIALDIVSEDKIRFVGYQLSSGRVTSGDELIVRLAWQPVRPLERDYSFFVHLVSPDGGPPLSQGDKTHQAARYQVGETLVDEYRMPLLPTIAAGRYTLLAGVYITFLDGSWQRLRTTSGEETIYLGEVAVEPPVRPAVMTHPLHLTFADGLQCVGLDYDTSLPGTLRAYVHCYRPQKANRFAPDGFETRQEQTELVLYRGAEVAARSQAPMTAGYATVALDMPAGSGDLRLELRTTVSEARIPSLSPWHRARRRPVLLPAPRRGERHIVFGDEMVLEQAQWVLADRWTAGKEGRVTLRLEALRPLAHDYTVSVSLAGTDGRFIAQHDGTPALGAIPTLKWIRGTVVSDLHPVSVPAETPALEAVLRLAIYDAFTLRPLAVSDERLSRLGQGTQMELGRVLITP